MLRITSRWDVTSRGGMAVSRWSSTEVRALRVAALRETQEEFAERAGYTLATIKKWHRATWDKPVRTR